MSLPVLWPVPRSVKTLPGTGLRPARGWRLRDTAPVDLTNEFADLLGPDGDGEVRLARDPSLPAEGYRLRHDADGATLAWADAAGCRNGLRTLRQLLDGDAPLSAVLIDDAPAVPIRGVMLDCARDRIPTLDQLERMVRSLAAVKANHLQLYTEHNVAYVGHETVWRDADPLSFEDLRRLDESCADHGIVLAANQNCLGHFERWLRHPPYDDLAELPEVRQRIPPRGFSCCSLNPTDPRALALVTGLLDQLLPCFRSGLVNIGCDETADIGQGRSRQAVADQGYGAVYGDFVGAVARHCLDLGARPQFWADMALAHPEALDRLPSQAVALAWGYEADADFAGWGRALADGGREWWACPGTSSWNSFGGRADARQGSITAAVAAATTAGAGGVLITDWGDNGHRQQWPVSLYALAEGLGLAWNPAGPVLSAVVGRHALGSAGLGTWLDAVSRLDPDLRSTATRPDGTGPLRNANLPFTDLLLPWGRTGWLDDPTPWLLVADRLQELGEPPTAAPALLRAECSHTREVLRLAVDRALVRRGAMGPRRADLAQRCRAIAGEHRRLWLRRCRPGGLCDSTGWYTAIAEELEDVTP